MNTKELFRKDWLMWLLIVAPLVPIIMNWDKFPDRIPTHWNTEGKIDSYGGKWALFLSPALGLGIYFLMLVLPKIDPRKKNYDLFSGAYRVFRFALVFLTCAIGFITVYASLGGKIDTGHLVMLLVLGLFLVMGNQMGKIRSNYFVGFRTPWTLENTEVWMKTHRFAGRLWVGSSLVMLAILFFIPPAIFAYIFMPVILTDAIIPFIYSWVIYKKMFKGNRPA